MDEKSYKNVFIYNIRYVKIKDAKQYLKINAVNTLYLIIYKVNQYFEVINKDQYLTLVTTNERKKNNKKIWRNGE